MKKRTFSPWLAALLFAVSLANACSGTSASDGNTGENGADSDSSGGETDLDPLSEGLSENGGESENGVTDGTCECNEAGPCCDGCHPINDFTECPDDGIPCTNDACQAGKCAHVVNSQFCLIQGTCIEKGAANPARECRVCAPGETVEDWSPLSGAACTDDGLSCTTDTCKEGVCSHDPKTGFCLIDKTCLPDKTPKPGDDCLLCNPASNGKDWSARADNIPCTDDGADCSLDFCLKGKCEHPLKEQKCLIGGQCLDDKNDNPENACQFCDSAAAKNAWSNKPSDAACEDGNVCTAADHCQDGACAGGDAIANDCGRFECGQSPTKCYSCGTCDPVSQVCWPETQYCAPETGGSCGDMSGLQAGSPWPMLGGCPTHQGRSSLNGPLFPMVKWAFRSKGGLPPAGLAVASDSTLYAPSWDEKRLYAIKPDGALKWSFAAETGIVSCPAIASDGTIYFGSSDNQLGPVLYAVDSNGNRKWAFETGDLVKSCPAIGLDGVIYFAANDQKVYAVNPNGTQKWAFPTPNASPDSFLSAPAIAPDGTIYIGSNDGKLHALKPNGDEKWNFTLGAETFSSPSIGADGTIYIGSGLAQKKLYAVRKDGQMKWFFIADGAIHSTPAIGTDGSIYFGTFEGHTLYALYPDGRKKWSYDAGAPIFQSGPVIGADGTIYFGVGDPADTNPGKVVALNPNGSKKWAFNLNSPNNSGPAIGKDGILYLGEQAGSLFALAPCQPDAYWCLGGWRHRCNSAGTGETETPSDCGAGGCGWGNCLTAGSLSMPGSFNGGLTVTDSASLRISRPLMTIEAWVKGNAGQILNKGRWTDNNANYVFTFSCGSGHCDIYIGINHSNTKYEWNARITSPGSGDSAWEHIAAVLDDNDHHFRAYYNGARITLITDQPPGWPAGLSLPSHADLVINSERAAKVDELRISDVARYGASDFSPSKHLEPDVNTLGLWHFDESGGMLVHDSSYYGNNGALSGSSSFSAEVP